MKKKLNIGVLISGGGSNLQAIIDAVAAGRLDANIVFVGSDNPAAKGLERAATHGIPSFVVDYASIIRKSKRQPNEVRYPQSIDIDQLVSKILEKQSHQDPQRLTSMVRSRIPAEEDLLRQMANYPFDLVVLAGFMRTLTPYIIDRINQPPGSHRIMNIHPALLPAFPGVDGYGDTFRYGCKFGGCTVHFVDYGEDTGPIIGQAAFPISETDDLDAVRKKGLVLEWQLYPQCIQYAAEGRLRVREKMFKLKNGRQLSRKVVEVLPE
jgi:phosphoribosylglycinamide formyltransferase-1